MRRESFSFKSQVILVLHEVKSHCGQNDMAASDPPHSRRIQKMGKEVERGWNQGRLNEAWLPTDGWTAVNMFISAVELGVLIQGLIGTLLELASCGLSRNCRVFVFLFCTPVLASFFNPGVKNIKKSGFSFCDLNRTWVVLPMCCKT